MYNINKKGFIFLPSLKGAWYLVHPGQNCNVREILRNLIGCFEDWELEKTDKSCENQNPGLVHLEGFFKKSKSCKIFYYSNYYSFNNQKWAWSIKNV